MYGENMGDFLLIRRAHPGAVELGAVRIAALVRCPGAARRARAERDVGPMNTGIAARLQLGVDGSELGERA
jgi:hypothetical protein